MILYYGNMQFNEFCDSFPVYTVNHKTCNIQRVHYKSMKCDVFIFTR